MRLISDVINYYIKGINDLDVINYFNLDESTIVNEELKTLYAFNMCGFYIPLIPKATNISLDKTSGWIELSKMDKKIKYHNNDNEKSRIGDIDVSNFHLIIKDEDVKEFIRIPDYYLYTNINVKTSNKNYSKINLTGEDIYMLNDAKNSDKKIDAICDYHEDGA